MTQTLTTEEPTIVQPSEGIKKCHLDIWDRSGVKHQFDMRKGMALSALKAKKSPIEFDCLEADCGICVVRVLSGAENLSGLQDRERDFLSAMHADPEERLACQCRILGPVEIRVEY